MLKVEILRDLSTQVFDAATGIPVGTAMAAGHSARPSADLSPNVVARRL
jgi:hypothetical protein